MSSTIEYVVKFLETCDPKDSVNIGSFIQYIVATKSSASSYYYCVSTKTNSWDVIQFNSGTTKVSEVLAFLKPHLPEHKDKYIGIHDKEKNTIETASTTIVNVKMHTLEFCKGISELPKVKFEETNKLWAEFQAEIQKVKTKSLGLDLLPIAQYLIMTKFDLKQIFCVENTFYRVFLDILVSYPELVDSDETTLFELKNGVNVCKMTDKELKDLCQGRKEVKYEIDDGVVTLDKLLELCTLKEDQIGKLFKLDLTSGKFVCFAPEILSAFRK